jgi:hypothetical protein
VIVVAHWVLTHSLHPRVFWDSSAYIEEAQQPFSFAQFFYPKPIFISLVLRVIGTDAGRIIAFQQWMSVLSWLCFTATLVSVLRTTRARVLALVAGAIIVLDPSRLGYGSALLSESINDSLLALVSASLLVVCSRERRTPWLVSASIITTCWMLTRDTNAVVALVALAVGLALLRPSPRRYARELVACGVATIVAVFVLWSTSVRPGNTHLTFQGTWPEDFRARITYSMMNNVMDRVIPDRAASEFFVEHGMPQRDALATLTLDQRERVISDPAFAAARHWIATDARHVWLRWLLSTPGQRIRDQWQHAWQLLGVADGEHIIYMPRRWPAHRLLLPIRGLTSNHALLAILLMALPFLVYRARRHRLLAMIVATIAGGWLGSLAAMYGDSAEIGRHCYGSGQQVVLGLVLALVVCVERGLARHEVGDDRDRGGRHEPVREPVVGRGREHEQRELVGEAADREVPQKALPAREHDRDDREQQV